MAFVREMNSGYNCDIKDRLNCLIEYNASLRSQADCTCAPSLLFSPLPVRQLGPEKPRMKRCGLIDVCLALAGDIPQHIS